ncbi:MAG TPA: hypothetical protein PLK08_04060, partial [Phycisphaerae bacterium]|nr:hypothetical protein [Phycisphaerae bacterium]
AAKEPIAGSQGFWDRFYNVPEHFKLDMRHFCWLQLRSAASGCIGIRAVFLLRLPCIARFANA